MPTAVIVTDLGFGDSGKGSITDALARKLHAEWVVRTNGGAQAAHNVVTPEGEHHTFSLFGSGTFVGCKTHLESEVIVDLISLFKEASQLETKGIFKPLALLSIDPNCKISTPWHVGLNQVRELSRGANAHGSCGLGIGETMADFLANKEAALYIRDLKSPGVLRTKLHSIKTRLSIEAEKLWNLKDLPERTAVHFSDDSFQIFYDVCRQAAQLLKVEVKPWIYSTQPVIFEGAQGVLLDENGGFHPHTTWSTTTSKNALDLLAGTNFTPYTLGLIRSYATRHGAGPFPTEDTSLTYVEPNNSTDTWQKHFRLGHLDLPLLKYALNINGGVDGLVVSHLDYINHETKVCTQYNTPVVLEQNPTLELQEDLTKKLLQPLEISLTPTPTENELLALISQELQLPIVLTSTGRTAKDKKFMPLFPL